MTRGIVICPSFIVNHNESITVNSSEAFPPGDIRKYLLYWDKIDYPSNGILEIGCGQDLQFLLSCGVAIRTTFRRVYWNSYSEIFPAAQEIAFENHEREEPGLWSLAQLSSAPYFVNSAPSPTIEFQLWNTLPIPTSDVPLHDILLFKEKRRDELLALRVYLDELYQSVIVSADIPRARNSAISKLELALGDVDRALDDFGISRTISSLRGYIAGAFGDMLGGGSLGVTIGPSIGMSPLIGGALGAGIAFAVKTVLTPRTQAGSHPLTYVSSIRREL